MPKYTPTYEDMYSTVPCYVCGADVLEENTDTCSPLCKQHLESFIDDWEWEMMQDLKYDEQREDF